jgi:DNA repair protein RadC
VHNHPSGDPTPSAADVALTVEIVAAGQLLDIELLDHLIIGQGRWLSLKRLGLGFLKAWHGRAAPRMWSAPATASPRQPARDDSDPTAHGYP